MTDHKCVDEEMADAADEQTPENPPATEQPAAEEPPPAEPDTAEATEATEAPSGSRRRRGRRQVMKKKTTRDAEGYLGASYLFSGFLQFLSLLCP